MRPFTLRVVQSPAQHMTGGLLRVPAAVTVGRNVDGGISIGDPQLSRHHLRLEHTEADRLFIEDLKSTNGTFVNKKRVPAAHLREGDVVRIGTTILVVTHELTDVERAVEPTDEMIGESPAFRLALARAAYGAPSDLSMLIEGETGTGKGLLATRVHQMSGLSGPFIAVNCAAIPETLAEATLFGHEAGAFTGASKARGGLFREADGGTLFLDEVGDLSPAVQARLLRAIEEKEIMPVGSARAITVNARVLAATNVDLDVAVAEGRFRADLFARLAEWRVLVPPLRERREDILPLARLFAREVLEPFSGEELLWSADGAEIMVMYSWPYNVREVRQVVRGIGMMKRHPPFGRRDLPAHIERSLTQRSTPAAPLVQADPAAQQPSEPPLPGTQRRPTKDELVESLSVHNGNIAAVARHFGRHRQQVYRWLHYYEIDGS
jgi:transcriptional regulator with GAF, ATPase, and Fis domain